MTALQYMEFEINTGRDLKNINPNHRFAMAVHFVFTLSR
jgi:hypothetical protein